jgi:hypothetical protein
MITCVVGLISQSIKKMIPKFTTKNVSHLIPIISLISGIILSVICYYTNLLNVGETLFESIISGAIAGAGMTGLHQLPTQMRKYYQNLSNNHDDVESLKNLIDSFKMIIDGVQNSITDNSSISKDGDVTVSIDNNSEKVDDISIDVIIGDCDDKTQLLELYE